MNGPAHHNVQIPLSLRQHLAAFRRRLWMIKSAEAVAVGMMALLTGWLTVFVLDRLHDTSAVVRSGILAIALLVIGWILRSLSGWIIGHRRPDQLARLLAQTRPAVGDQLLGVIELASDQGEQARSPQLAAAAIQQAADEISRTDLSAAIPSPRHRRYGAQAGGLLLLLAALGLVAAPAVGNAWHRFLLPWQQTPRYTFASLKPLPDRLVVPRDEDFEVALTLDPSSRWRPATATATIADRPSQISEVTADGYTFRLPGRLRPETLKVAAGDFRGQILVQPKLRPELESVAVAIELPQYLGRSQTLRTEVHGSSISVVRGSRAALTAIASQPLAGAFANGQPMTVSGTAFSTPMIVVDQPTPVACTWSDLDAVECKAPYEFEFRPVDDQPPTVVTDGLPRQKVLLESEVLRFQVRAEDDFGVQRVGLQWQAVAADGSEPTPVAGPAGETWIGAGHPRAETLDLAAAFAAAELSLAGHRIALRAFAEDYLPGRPRVYSAPAVFDVLSGDQHAAWITAQLSRWQRTSFEVRDRELRLHETNKELREMTPTQRAEPENRQRLARQAELERAGAAELAGLVRGGQRLFKEAIRNPQIGVGHLDRWAKLIQTLQQIADERMPSVAELLQQAATAEAVADDQPRSAGRNRLTPSGAAAATEPASEPAMPATPTVTDIESSQLDVSAAAAPSPAQQQSSGSRLTLPNTLLAGPGSERSSPLRTEPAETADKLDQAIEAQAELLAEFAKVAGELDQILANLEASTFVKRLKAAARQQQQVAARLASLATDLFGVPPRQMEHRAVELVAISDATLDGSRNAARIIDDLEAYFGRTRVTPVQRVLAQMESADVSGELQRLSEAMRRDSGLAIAEAEYWSDAFDRWAEDLVGACQGGECPGAQTKGSLPPSLVLEVMQILEGEVNLREQTRVAEQARPARQASQHLQAVEDLWQTQEVLRQRTDQALAQIGLQPEADQHFGDELALLQQVSGIMVETIEILRDGNTGPAAIAAETEIIELLLQSKRFSPSGGGGASAPGGGGEGETETPALALAGAGINANEVREQPSAAPAAETSDATYPVEYQQGLDAYFHQLEAWRSQP